MKRRPTHPVVATMAPDSGHRRMFAGTESWPSVLRRIVLVGGGCATAAGALAGLVVGLVGWPPTAWAALIEGAVIVGLVGSTASLVVGLLLLALRGEVRRLRR